MGEITDLLFTLLGKFGGYLNARGKRICFVIWIACLVYWFCRDLSLGLMVQAGGCFWSFGMHCYGFYNWRKNKIGS